MTVNLALVYKVGYYLFIFLNDTNQDLHVSRDRCRTTNLAVLHLYCVAFTHYICKGKLGPSHEGIELSSAEEDEEEEEGSRDSKKNFDLEEGSNVPLAKGETPAAVC